MYTENRPSSHAPTLRSRLNKLIFIAFLPVAVAVAADALLSRTRALADAREQAVEEVSLAAAYQEKHQAYVRALLATVAASHEGKAPDPQACGGQLRAMMSKLEKFANFGVMDASGYVICARLPGEAGQSFADRSYFREARNNKDLSVSTVTTGALSGLRAVIFGYPLIDAQGYFNGVIFATFKDSQFASLPLSWERSIGSRLAYFDRDGRFIATDPPAPSSAVQDLGAAELVLLRSSSSATRSFDAVGRDGKKRIAALGPVRTPAQGAVAYVRVSLDEDHVLAAWRDGVLRRAAGLVLALLCGVVVARFLLEKWLIRDLRKLVGFTSAVRQGLTPEAPGNGRTEETGIALNSVVTMADTLRRQRSELLQLHAQASAANVELERRVQDRTRELQHSESLYRALANAIPQIVWSGTAEQGITYINKAWELALGESSPQAIGRDLLDYLHPDDRERAARIWNEAVRNKSVFSGQFAIRCADGKYHHYMLRSAPVIGSGGSVESWAGVGTDITELKAIEEALRMANSELHSFSYSVSHDLRAPLNAINGFASVLLSDFGDELSPQARHYLERIAVSSRHMSSLIDDLLKLSQLSAVESTLVDADLSAICNEIVASLREAEPERDIVAQIEPGMLAPADPRLLRIALGNLLGNAWKFTRRSRPARITVGRLTQDGETVFYVKDNGTGFDMRYADKLFGVFQRLHSNREFPGTGIGLATVRRVIARHHGRIWTQARPNEGATFYFTIGTERDDGSQALSAPSIRHIDKEAAHDR